MKKIGILTIFMLLAGVCPAETNQAFMKLMCRQGVVSESGFCFSNARMNWWSALNWCEAKGLRFARMPDVCPDWVNGMTGKSKCSRVFDISFEDGGAKNTWTATASGAEQAYQLSNPQQGTIEKVDRTEVAHTLCIDWEE